VLLRNASFQVVRALARKEWAAAAAMVSAPEGDDPWTAPRLEQALSPFFAEHPAIRLDPSARAPSATRVTKTGRGTWEVIQTVCDSDMHDDWALSLLVPLDASAKEGRPVLMMTGIAR
jgi:hypothetical protein